MMRPGPFLATAAVVLLCAFAQEPTPIASRVVDPQREPITMHWKDKQGKVIGNIGALKAMLHAQGQQLIFGMNGGMYTADHGPVGLYIENGRILHRIDRRTEGRGNFHMQPNGVFGVYTDGTAFVKTTAAMQDMRDVRYATQSGPMLVAGGIVNKNFTPGSKNLHIRNGVGVRSDGHVVFAISREPVNFHDFATWFKQQGCDNALYLDGAVSKAYIPEQASGMDGELGVLIAVATGW
ncbi:MAG: phosphodiester glycosidase family protein [Flavobacteriales bacterium]|nr:phosphodiester glycosidase family protein [Flavobacteriales bacterium]